MKLFIASDHGGFLLKKDLIESLTDIEWDDLGCLSKESVDYPDYAQALCEKIDKKKHAPSRCFSL